jgi:hypothetical protein
VSLGDPEGLEGSEAEDVVEVEPETPVVELAPGATAIAEESPSVDMLPLADLDPRGVALDPELAKRQATRAEQVVIDAAACDPSRPRPESAGLLVGASASPADYREG